MMLVTVARPPAICAAMSPQKFSAATTERRCAGGLVAADAGSGPVTASDTRSAPAARATVRREREDRMWELIAVIAVKLIRTGNGCK
jgi:hypothetical protein